MRESIGPRISILVACTLAVAACDSGAAKSDDASDVGGSIVIAAQNEPRTLLPPLITQIDEKIVADQIFEPLAWLGDEGHLDRDYRPGLADSWSWEKDSTAIVFRLNPKARWQDGTPVRASDVRFTFGLYADSVVGFKDRSSLAHIDSVTARDSVTAVFWFKDRYAEQFYDAAARLLIVPEHLLTREPRATLLTSAFGRQPVGSGRFRLGKWTPNASIELVADTANYRGRPKLDRVIFAVTTDANALSARLTTGEIDLAEVSTPALFRGVLKSQPDLRAHMNPAYDYSFLLFNARQPKQRQQPNALFADIGLRRAISMGLDRNKLVRSQFDSLAIVSTGPMTRAQPLADSTIRTIAYDSAGAARLLDSFGWTLSAGKTVRERRGHPLKFSVLVPTVSPNRMAMIVAIQESLRKLGVEVVVDAVDGNTFMARMAARDFDVMFDGRRVEPGVSGLSAWTVASARDANGLNFGNYENPRFDAHLDSALAARDLASARPHAKQAYETIVADVPAVWIYETRTATLMHKRIRPVHIVSTAWWAGIADWSIPPGERLPRDRVGLRVAAR